MKEAALTNEYQNYLKAEGKQPERRMTPAPNPEEHADNVDANSQPERGAVNDHLPSQQEEQLKQQKQVNASEQDPAQHVEPQVQQEDAKPFQEYLTKKAQKMEAVDDIIPEVLDGKKPAQVNETVKFEQGGILAEPPQHKMNNSLKAAHGEQDQQRNTSEAQDAYVQQGTFKSRKLNSAQSNQVMGASEDVAGFPWEKKGTFRNIMKVRKKTFL